MRRGFTLVELLVALGIFAIVCVPLFQTEMLAGRSVAALQERREGLAIAAARLDALQQGTSSTSDLDQVSGYQVITTSDHVNGLPVPLTRIGVEVRREGRTVASLAAYRL